MARYIPIGSPLNRAEVEGLRRLRDNLPAHFTLIGNFELQLPQRRNTLEFDAIIIGEGGIYVIEIKGWSGDISGDIRRWQLPWKRVESPFIRNETRAKALRAFLAQRLDDYPAEFACESIVYLPAPKTHISLNDPRQKRLLLRGQEAEFFESLTAQSPCKLSPEFQAEVEELLIPLSTPTSALHKIPNYIIREDLSSAMLPYKEYIAQHSILRSRGKVRIKSYTLDLLLQPDQRDEAFASTLSEIEALNTLEQVPYVARAYELIRDLEDELVFHVVSEWVGAHTLRDVLKSEHSQPLEQLSPLLQHERWTLASELTRAVQTLHKHNITHRNLSPETVVMTQKKDATTTPFKLIDFDFARVGRFDGHEDALRRNVSLGYGAPELWAPSYAHDHRVDVYSLGAILFELFTSQPLYGEEDQLMRHDEIWHMKKNLIQDDELLLILGQMLSYHSKHRPDCLESILQLFIDKAQFLEDLLPPLDDTSPHHIN